MPKNIRQAAILRLIRSYNIETQDELTERLKDEGISATQATVSRDIKEMRLTKMLFDDGSYKYAVQEHSEAVISDRLARMFHDSVLSMEVSGQIIVIKTLSGSANVAGEAIDSFQMPEILGTLAGDNTIMAVLRNADDATVVLSRFRELLGTQP